MGEGIGKLVRNFESWVVFGGFIESLGLSVGLFGRDCFLKYSWLFEVSWEEIIFKDIGYFIVIGWKKKDWCWYVVVFKGL